MIASPSPRLDLVIGIDGGATHTDALLAEAATGAAIGRGTAGPSNIQAVGVEAALRELDIAVGRAFEAAGLPRTVVGAAYYGVPLGATIFSFTDGSPGVTASDFSATIDWGDGSSSPGPVILDGGFFEVQTPINEHVYAQPGQYTVIVTVSDQEGNSITASLPVAIVPQVMTVYEAPVYATTGLSTSASSPIALVVDPNPGSSPTDTPTLSWGDGTTSSGTLTGSGGLFQLTGSHTYTVGVGTYAVSTTLNFAPTQELPLVTATFLATDNDVKAQPTTGKRQTAMGTFEWDVFTRNEFPNRVTGKFSYVPTQNNPATKIVFLQCCIQRALDNKPMFLGETTKEYYAAMSTDPKKTGNHLDVLRGDTTPYYAVVWGQTPRPPFPPGYVVRPGAKAFDQIGSGTPMVPAQTMDGPEIGRAFVRQKMGDFVALYETAAFCIDTQQVLGVITWGMKIEDKEGAPVEILKGTQADSSSSVSATFKDIIKFVDADNKFPNGINNVMTHALIDGKPKISAPDTSVMDLKGTSALP